MKHVLILISIFMVHWAFAQNNTYRLNNTPLEYRLDYTQNSSMLVGDAKPKKSSRNVHLEFSIKGKAHQDSLVGILHFKTSEAKQAIMMGAQKLDTRNLTNKDFNFSVMQKGSVIRTKGKNPGVVLGASYGGIMHLDDLLSYHFLQLPDKPLTEGTEWKSTLVRSQIEGVATITPTLHLSHKVVGREKVNGIECFRIETSISSAIKTEVKIQQHPAPFEYDGIGNVRIIWFFDDANGRTVKLSAVENSTGTIGMATISQETTIELIMSN